MKKKYFQLLFFAIFTLNLTACGTIMSITDGDLSVYSGAKKDLEVLQSGGILSIFATIDLPLSFVLDTLMLPVTLSR